MSDFFFNLTHPKLWIYHPEFLVGATFQLWMMIHAVLRREWLWLLFMTALPGLGAFWYFINVYWSAPSVTRGFELPGGVDRRRIKELQAQIHHLDKAHHHSQLGDIYFQQGKLEPAETSYRAALERDPEDLDTRSHLGQCLLRRKKPLEARPLLEGVLAAKPEHDYGYTMMALAETLAALGETDRAIAVWKQVTENHSYPRAKVQLAELYAAKNQRDLAATELKDLLADEAHMPAFQRRRDRVWLSRGKALRRKLG